MDAADGAFLDFLLPFWFSFTDIFIYKEAANRFSPFSFYSDSIMKETL